jgi:glutamate--cysteine ligase
LKYIENKNQLIEYFISGSKPKNNWKIGAEHEKFLFDLKTKKSIPYDGEISILKIFSELMKNDWVPIKEGTNILGLIKDKKNITLEPGLQFELSGDAVQNIHQTCSEINSYLKELKIVCAKLGIGLLGNGFAPIAKLSDVYKSPKKRYDIMRKYMPNVGRNGLDMMHRTCATQVNLDYSNETDYKRKSKLIAAITPVAVSLFSNSPFKEKELNGYLSYRTHIWQDTDKNRSGIPEFFLDNSNSFERYVDFALKVPMYFIITDDEYIDCTGESFNDFLSGKLKNYLNKKPTIQDWENHVSTIFTELRLKKYLEIRSADSCSSAGICSIPAFWTGLLYDEDALEQALEYVKDWNYQDVYNAYLEVPKKGFDTEIRNKKIFEHAKKIIDFSVLGLKNRKQMNSKGMDENIFLKDIHNFIKDKKSPAQYLIEKYNIRWKHDILKIFDEEAF